MRVTLHNAHVIECILAALPPLLDAMTLRLLAEQAADIQGDSDRRLRAELSDDRCALCRRAFTADATHAPRVVRFNCRCRLCA